MHALLWVIDGMVAGWLMGKLMAGEGREWVMDVVMGMVGGVAGGSVASALGSLVRGRMIFTDLAAMLSAVILTALSRFVGGRREYGTTD